MSTVTQQIALYVKTMFMTAPLRHTACLRPIPMHEAAPVFSCAFLVLPLACLLLLSQFGQTQSKGLHPVLPLPGRDCKTLGRLTAWACTSSSSRSSPSSYMNPLQAIVGWCMPRCFFNTCAVSQMHAYNCAAHPGMQCCGMFCRYNLAKGICKARSCLCSSVKLAVHSVT